MKWSAFVAFFYLSGFAGPFGCASSDSASSIANMPHASAIKSLHFTSTLLPGLDPAKVSQRFVGLDVTINDSQAASSIYQQTLDVMSAERGGVGNCPNGVGIVYHLDFGTGTQDVLIDVELTGCESVSVGDVSHGTVFYNDAFWSSLAKALVVPEGTIYPYEAPL